MASTDGAAKLYVILGSHACRTGMLLLEHKGIDYRTVTIPTGMQRMLPAKRFKHGTVPALVIDGTRLQKNPAIARYLDERQPDPPLFPADPEHRREVEEAERWGDDEFQMSARRLILAASHRGAVVDDAEDGRLGPLLYRHRAMRKRMVPMIGRLVFNATPKTEPRLLDTLLPQLDKIDAWLESGVLGGERLYAADYMIATSYSLLTYCRDLLPALEARGALPWVDRVLAARG
jgi:glutathione S-transferase